MHPCYSFLGNDSDGIHRGQASTSLLNTSLYDCKTSNGFHARLWCIAWTIEATFVPLETGIVFPESVGITQSSAASFITMVA